MALERKNPDDARTWLARAKSNLVRARTVLPNTFLEDYCFDAQQAAEKALKGVLVARDQQVPRTHDLAFLISLLASEWVIPDEVLAGARLTRFAVTTRYPGTTEPITSDDHHRAVAIAATIVEWAEAQVGGQEGAPE